MACSVTPAPRATTIPTISWPGITGSRGSGNSPSTRWRSVRHTPQARTASSTWPGPGSGRARSIGRKARRGASKTIARIVADMGALAAQLLQRFIDARDGDDVDALDAVLGTVRVR